MKRNAIHSAVEPACAYCEHGQMSCDKETVLCVKKGVMQPDSHCRKFSYDPLRRVPRVKPTMPTYSAEDFSID